MRVVASCKLFASPGRGGKEESREGRGVSRLTDGVSDSLILIALHGSNYFSIFIAISILVCEVEALK